MTIERSPYQVGCVVVVPQLVNKELPDDWWSLPVLEAYSRYRPYETLCKRLSVANEPLRQPVLYLSYEVFRKIAEVVRSWHIRMVEKIWFGILGVVTIAQEQLEQVE